MSIPGPEDERRADTVAVSRQTAKITSTVVGGLLVAGALALFSGNDKLNVALNDIKNLEEDIEFLKTFGPGSGPRFTSEDAKVQARELKQAIRDVDQASIRRNISCNKDLDFLRQSVGIHHEAGAHTDADRRLSRAERRLDKLDGGK